MVRSVTRSLILVIGVLSLVLGIIGIFVPLLPTTPFLLLSAYCFSRGSRRLHDWLVGHRVFGPPIRDWKESGVIRRPAKIAATLVFIASAVAVFPNPRIPVWGKGGFVLVAIGVLSFLWTRPSLPRVRPKGLT